MDSKTKAKYKLLTIQDLLSLTCLSRSSINLKIANGDFPKPIYQSQNKRLWKESDYMDWVDNMASDGNDERFKEHCYENGEGWIHSRLKYELKFIGRIVACLTNSTQSRKGK